MRFVAWLMRTRTPAAERSIASVLMPLPAHVDARGAIGRGRIGRIGLVDLATCRR